MKPEMHCSCPPAPTCALQSEQRLAKMVPGFCRVSETPVPDISARRRQVQAHEARDALLLPARAHLRIAYNVM